MHLQKILNEFNIIMMKTKVFAAAVFMAAAVNAGAQDYMRDWAQFGRYAQENEKITSSPYAVFMGDSITDGWDDSDPSFFPDNGFVCRGISGQTTSEMLVRFRQDVIDLRPKYVVILAGTNDVAQNNGFITLEDVMDNLVSMCELAKLHKIKPVLCSVTPASSFGWRPEIKDAAGKIEKLNGMIREYAESRHILYIDYHSALKNDKGGMLEEYSSDGVHPNKDCYKIMERIVLEAL